jgi:RNA polymerase sigma-70 factor (ECF subfamily)
MPDTSPTLLERLRQPGDQDAWATFVHLYTPLFYKWTQQLGMQPAEAADLIQDVFVNLLKALPTFELNGQQSFRAWLSTVVRNRFRDLRRKRVPIATGVDFDDATVDDPVLDLDAAEHREFITDRALQLVRKEFAPATWRAFWGVVVEGRQASDVARECNLTTNAVYLARGRVLRRLRSALRGIVD